MKKTHSIINYSLFAVLISTFSVSADAAGIRVGNMSRSYAGAYNQVNAMRQQADYYNSQPTTIVTPSTDTENNLPVRVADKDLAEKIINGNNDTPVVVSQLEQCAAIYPNGEFAWDRPTLGLGAGGSSTCVAVVEMRGYQMGANGSDVVLARANLAAGDSVKCNISEFPDATYTVDAGNIEFPADREPTMDDVVKVMNEEQKQNAVLKIAAGAILGGIGGNIAGKNDLGNDGLIGTDKGKLQGTAIGALSGAAVMAGNAYAGKVVGDVILSTSVNAVAGGVIGNIMASGDSVLRIEDCELNGRETSCLWGMLVSSESLKPAETAFYNTTTRRTLVCDQDMKNCKEEELVNVKLEAYPDKNIDEIQEQQFEEIINNEKNQYYIVMDGGNRTIVNALDMEGKTPAVDQGIFTKISSAGRVDRQIAAMIPDVRDKAFGMKQSDWREWKSAHRNGVTIYGRSTQGQPYNLPEDTEYSINDFYPMMVNAEDGGIIDFSNKARLKTTLIGAGAGGALGAFVGYQGAQSDIENRWVTAVREYKDSLQKVYCVTGDRFLGYYNDVIIIPNM